MNKILKFALLLICAIVFTACSDDNDGPKKGGGNSSSTSGVYVLCEGNYYSNINGSLTRYEPKSGVVTQNVFSAANNRALVGTMNDGLVYGSKLYMANTDESTIEVADVKSGKSIKQISCTSARCLIAEGGYVYVTSFTSGAVSKIDTATLKIVASVECGTYPEGMAVLDGHLYVANSGYGSGKTLTKINLATFTVAATITVPVNPVELYSDGKKLYIRCSGEYNADYTYKVNPAVYVYEGDDKTTMIAEATIAAIGDGYIYMIDANYYKSTVTYSRYNLSTNTVNDYTVPASEIFSPSAIGVNPSNGDVYVLSYNSKKLDDNTFVTDFNANGYCVRFDRSGKKKASFDVGVGGSTFIFY